MRTGLLVVELCSRSIARVSPRSLILPLGRSIIHTRSISTIMPPEVRAKDSIATCADVWESNAGLGMCSIPIGDVKDDENL